MKQRRPFVMQVTSPLAVLYSTSTMEHHHFDQAHSSPLTNWKFRLVPVVNVHALPRNYLSKETVVVDFESTQTIIFQTELRRWTWTGDFKCREVKTGFCRNISMQTGSSRTLIGWKSGQTTFVPLWDWRVGAWLRTRGSQSGWQFTAHKFEASASGPPPHFTAHKSQLFHLCSHTKIKYIFLLKTIAYAVFSPLSEYVS